MKTLRELHEGYIEENKYEFITIDIKRQKTVIRFLKDYLDMEYDKISDEMMDLGISRAKSDLERTRLAFLIHEYDRETGVSHSLAYDRKYESELMKYETVENS